MAILKSDPLLEYSEYSDNNSNDISISSSSASSISSGDDVEQYSIYKYDEVPENKSWASTLPTQKGLYNPEYEKDNCGVGMYYKTKQNLLFFFSSFNTLY